MYIISVVLVLIMFVEQGNSGVLVKEKSVDSGNTFVSIKKQKSKLSFNNLPKTQLLIDGNTKSEKVSFDYGSTWSHDKKPKLDSYIISDTYQINEIIKYDIDEYYIFDICGVKINKKPTELDKGIYMILEKENNYVFKIMVTK